MRCLRPTGAMSSAANACELCEPSDVVFEHELAYISKERNALSRAQRFAQERYSPGRRAGSARRHPLHAEALADFFQKLGAACARRPVLPGALCLGRVGLVAGGARLDL